MLIALLTIPLLTSLILLFIKKTYNVKFVAITAASAELLLTIFLLFNFIPANGFQYVFDKPWIAVLGINFNIGIDGIGMLMILLTNLLMLIIILAGIRHNPERINHLYFFLLLTQTFINGIFISLNAFLFYIFWELSIIPVYFIILLWGGGNRQKITLKFFLFNLGGSLMLLFAFIFLYLKTPVKHSTDIQAFYNICLQPATQKWLFWFIFAGFAVKMPLFPLHAWQPDTYTTAPVQGSMLLSGIMSKMGIYGMIRWLLPVIPWAVYQWKDVVIILSIISVLYAGIIAFKQKDLKTLAAYSSMAHIGLICAGIFALNIYSLQGVFLQVFAHVVNIAGLFFIIDIIEIRTKTRNPSELGGIKSIDGRLAVFFMIILLGAIALPLTNSFAGEFLIFLGLYKINAVYTIITGLTIIIGAVYMLYIYQKVMLGKTAEATASFIKINWKESVVLLPINILIIFFGLFPQPIIELIRFSLQNILNNL